MTTYCKVENGVVTNRTSFTGDMPEGWAVPSDVWIASETGQIGWSYAGGELLAPVPPSAALPTVFDVEAERARRLALGFDYGFGDARGVHHIGTTEQDMKGWDEVSKACQAMIALGQGSGTLQIVTNTGPATITALEWQKILLAATAARQPLWAASFSLQGMSPIPSDYTADKYWS